MEIIQRLVEQDKKIWYKINVLWQNKILDTIAPILRNPNTWIPLYVFWQFLFLINMGKRVFIGVLVF